jgi:SAM-dependent methyltransferase
MREKDLQRLSDYRRTRKSHHYFLHYDSLNRDLAKAVSTYAAKRVLDIGCGNKPYEKMFEGKSSEYIGCDIVQSSLKKVDIVCEAGHIPLDDESFETVFSTQTIEHVADHQALVNEAFRVLKPDGCFIVSGPMYWHLHEEPYDFFRFTKYGFRHILEQAGFEVVEICSNGGKWAVLGQVIIHTLPPWLTNGAPLRLFHNCVFSWLDKRYYSDINTLNYLAVAKKPTRRPA